MADRNPTPIRVLIVDDEPEIRDAYRQVLAESEAQYRARQALRGEAEDEPRGSGARMRLPSLDTGEVTLSAGSESALASAMTTRREERAVVRNGKIEAAHVMTVGLATDHRAVDGALGAELLAAFKTLIENPVMMVV